MNKGRYHVISRSGDWALKREGAAKAQKIYPTRTAASNAARKYQNMNFDVVIHDTDGTISAWRRAR